MFIQTESTPNPNSIKFILDGHDICSEPIEFNSSKECSNSKLANDLLQIEGVENILFNKNYISVNKNNFTWDQLKAPILKVISSHISSGLPAIENENTITSSLDNIKFEATDLNTVSKIDSILKLKIRPAIMQDGGDVKFVKYDSGIVYLTLKGSCAGCPSATLTLKSGIENLLKGNIPEVKKVEQVTD